MSRRARGALGLAVLTASPAAWAGAPVKPFDLSRSDAVTVEMRLIDAVVVDEDGRTVPGLGKDDFEVFLGGVPVAIDTFDVRCPPDPTPDVRTVRDVRDRRSAAVPDAARKIVLVVDYPSLSSYERAFVLDDLKRVVRHGKTPAEQVMVVALVGRVRIEQGFTSDGEEILGTLGRMNRDVSLWLPTFHLYSAADFFGALTALVDSLAAVEGEKALVVYSKLTGSEGVLERHLREVAASAQDASVALFPVYVLGINMPVRDNAPWLARLASDTGGRFSPNALDLTIGYARAQRDLACRYTFGVYVRGAGQDRSDPVVVRSRRPGLRTIAPGVSVSRSPESKRRSQLRSAMYLPEAFESPLVHGYVFPLCPRTRRTWEALLAVEFPAAPPSVAGAASVVDFGAILWKGDVPVWTFNRRVTVRGARSRLVFTESLDLEPGTYRLAPVVEDSSRDVPLARQIVVEVPPVPKEKAFVVGPLLGRRAGRDTVIEGHPGDPRRDRIGDPETFRPLLVEAFGPSVALEARTGVCASRGGASGVELAVRRSIRREDGALVEDLAPVAVRAEGEGRILCQDVVDDLPLGSLAPDRYVFEASIEREGRPPSVGRSRFVVESEEERGR